MTPLTLVCWKWRPLPGYRSKFEAVHVNTLRAMFARHYPDPHEFVCITDDPEGIEPGIRVIPLWDEFSEVPNPHDRHIRRNPSCYRRLRMFRLDAREWLGTRILSLDLDCVITADMRPMVNRKEDFVIWGDTNPTTPYNGSMILFTAGARPQLYHDFDPATTPAKTLAKGYFGSDQAWIGLCLGPDETKWTQRDGIYSYRNDIGPAGILPPNARVVMFHGEIDPWSPCAQEFDWVKRHYRP